VVRVLLVAVALLGCRDERTCEPAITAAAERLIAAGDTVGLTANAAHEIRNTMVMRCEADSWSAEVLDCIAKVRIVRDLEACRQQLTHAQYVRLEAQSPGPASTPEADAGVAELWVGPIPMDAAPPRSPVRHNTPPATNNTASGTACATHIVDPRNRSCIAQYCRAHPDDVRCQLE
jgi:hypothetical protein